MSNKLHFISFPRNCTEPTSMDISQTPVKRYKIIPVFEIVLILFFSFLPLFAKFPFRVNIFLSWEGAYRMSRGEVPYRDFGMPLGYMFWVIPALFFKLFGTQMVTLVKAQILINIISGLAFRSILKSLGVNPVVRFLAVLLYCLSYIFFNFWPWYNQTVIVYQITGLAFLFRFMFAKAQTKWNWVYLILSALFTFFSFFTKQDAGGMAFIMCLVLVSYYSINSRASMPLIVYLSSFILIAALFIVPLLKYNFGYWFNHGQPPHTSRVDFPDILDEFFYSSQWIKFYLFMAILLTVLSVKSFRELILNKRLFIFLLLTLGILCEASILQVTSYTPPDNNIFFHSFAFVFIFSLLAQKLNINFHRPGLIALCTIGIVLWWSGSGWKYFQKITQRFYSGIVSQPVTSENIVNRKTYKIDPNSRTDIPISDWKFSNLKSFHNIYMPRQTVDGMERLKNMPLLKSKGTLKVLNMTELTPLAVELPYQVETGRDQPLWYHLGVAMFNKEAAMFEQRIKQHQYDLVLFENIPNLNNFYPFRIRDSLMVYYQKVDSFAAPRSGDTQGMIEVYTK